MSANTILLASHGTEGARAAERLALELCDKGGRVHHLIVVPSFWKGMTGDDWLNNGVTRDRFRQYLEDQLEQEVEDNLTRVNQAAAHHALHYSCEVVVGEPDKCLVKAIQNASYDLLVTGSPRPRGKPGLSSRMLTKITRNLPVRMVVAPYPDE